ncbi:VOC domain-containing protein [Cupriavidus oxalaticus]|uniref:VOC family protein n=1 Tax=Cupriavidus oxalaticus TaxID=96344 RepID=UPI003F73BD86
MSHHSHQDANVLATVNAIELEADAMEKAALRRSRNRIRGLQHHAYYCTDVEKTRHFYEDILEMPMTIALRIPDEVFTGKPAPYCHFFFEMGDGSAIAFFDYPDMFDDKPRFEVESVYHHHIAVTVTSDEALDYFRQRLEADGYPCTYVDHGAFHSLYLKDPNGMHLELCYVPPLGEEFNLRSSRVAHSELGKWCENRGQV